MDRASGRARIGSIGFGLIGFALISAASFVVNEQALPAAIGWVVVLYGISHLVTRRPFYRQSFLETRLWGIGFLGYGGLMLWGLRGLPDALILSGLLVLVIDLAGEAIFWEHSATGVVKAGYLVWKRISQAPLT
ncbi:MAG: hypothetical protein QOE92_2276 [Chloroflexota bacterium]|jgi:hypothetical protein|nr:hypothetical protein [Chloroflexota bacterium]